MRREFVTLQIHDNDRGEMFTLLTLLLTNKENFFTISLLKFGAPTPKFQIFLLVLYKSQRNSLKNSTFPPFIIVYYNS